MSITLEKFNNIMSDDTLLFTIEEMQKYPTNEQLTNYKTSHPYYNGKYIEIWTLYFEIIEHLAGQNFSGKEEEEQIMKLSLSSKNWIPNETHDVKYVSLLFSILSKKMTEKMIAQSPFEKEWEMLMNYTSIYLPNQIKYMLADEKKSGLFGKYNVRNLSIENQNMMKSMLK